MPQPGYYLRDGWIYCETEDDRPEHPDGYPPDPTGQGWLWCRCYSVKAPEGEGGYVHVSQLRAIPREAFEAARTRGWAGSRRS